VRYLAASDILSIHQRLVMSSGGPVGVRDSSALASCVGQPFQTFSGEDLYDSFVAKAAALASSSSAIIPSLMATNESVMQRWK
jgi:death-on-curing protein